MFSRTSFNSMSRVITMSTYFGITTTTATFANEVLFIKPFEKNKITITIRTFSKEKIARRLDLARTQR